MKKKILLAAFFISCITLFSCQKEVDRVVTNPPVDPPSVTGDSIYLDKIFGLYDDGSGIDTQEVYNVNYDSRKRVTDIHDSLRNHPGIEPVYDFYFSYNGTDTLPSRSIFIDAEDLATNSTFIDTVYHFYDASGRKIRDSVINTSSYSGTSNRYLSVVHYSYGNNIMYGETNSNDFNGDISLQRDTAILDAQGNILSSKKYAFDNATSTFSLASSSVFTYDTHPHPFSKLSCFRYFYNFPIGETLFTEYAGFNNTLSQHESVAGNTYDFTSVYTYKTNGLPATVQSTYPGGIDDKMIFKYRAL
jgi:hypothetical protein